MWRGFRAISKLSASQFQMLQPLYSFALIGNDLRLPDQRNRHCAHGDQAENEDKANMRIASRNAKSAANPIHGKRSPSTRLATRANSQQGHAACPPLERAILPPLALNYPVIFITWKTLALQEHRSIRA